MRHLSFASLLLLFLVLGCKARDEPAPNLVGRATTTRLAPEVRLTEHGGRVFDLSAERGKVVALFFGYTNCPDICPVTLADFAGVRRRLGTRADQVRLVFISVDPKRDTPQKAQEYARAFDREIIGLSGDSSLLAQVQRGFRTASYAERDTTGHGHYAVTHSSSVYLIGADGTLHETVRYNGSGVDILAAAINRLLEARGS